MLKASSHTQTTCRKKSSRRTGHCTHTSHSRVLSPLQPTRRRAHKKRNRPAPPPNPMSHHPPPTRPARGWLCMYMIIGRAAQARAATRGCPRRRRRGGAAPCASRPSPLAHIPLSPTPPPAHPGALAACARPMPRRAPPRAPRQPYNSILLSRALKCVAVRWTDRCPPPRCPPPPPPRARPPLGAAASSRRSRQAPWP